MIDNPENTAQKSVRYFLNDCTCGSRKQKHTVREWLARFGIPEHEEFFLLWSDVITSLSETFHFLIEKKVSNKCMDSLWNIVYAGLYLDYDTSKDFMPQFRATAEKLLTCFNKEQFN